ncbi:MAG: universal stress protein [Planctomycetota bacterium]|nr:universal stress protein [Planctomycetota bacterium]MCB9826459.1 universal stress protein [Planctomycetota bacterium]MCB9902740.1 universal stress protein [Planctomycetota bacterium]
MRGFEKVLVPLDFSDGRSEIFDVAMRVRSDTGTILLLHVIEWLPQVTEGTFGVYAHRSDMEKYKSQAKARLERYRRQHADVPIECLVREGKPATTILEEIDEQQPDIVVMGTHGRSRLDHLLIGSVAERVLRRAGRPVLAVPFRG